MSAMELSHARCRFKVRRRPWLDQSSPTLMTNVDGASAARRPHGSSADLSRRGLLVARNAHNFAVGPWQAPPTAPNQSPGVPREGEFLSVINLRHERPEASFIFWLGE
jgi:hypothetical protein